MNKDEMKNRISMALKDHILQQGFEIICKNLVELEKENAELRKVAEFQQSSNMDTHLENKKLKEVLAVGTTCNKGLIARNKLLEEECDKYRNMVFDKMEQIDKAKEIIRDLLSCLYSVEYDRVSDLEEAEQFLKESE